jgi:hypothetical protein
MKFRNLIALAAVVGFSLVILLGVAAAHTVVTPQKRPARASTVSALSQPIHLSRSQRRELKKLRAQIARSASTAMAATADSVDAHPVALPNDLGDAWVTSAAGGAVCTFIPDPIGGYGSSCASQADLQNGGAITVLGGAGELEGEAIAVMVVTDGSQAPVIVKPDGSKTVAPVDGIGAQVLPQESNITIGDVSIDVPQFDPACGPATGGAHTECGS